MGTADTAIYALTQQGAMTAAKIAAAMEVDVYLPPAVEAACSLEGAEPFDSLRTLLGRTFFAYRRHIFITAAGVAVRCIAPYLKDKSIDPAVAVLDQRGKNVISLLSGHLGGANKLTLEVAEILGGQPVITTATDTENVPSLDILALEFNLAIANIRAVAKVNGALLAGNPVIVDDPDNMLQLKGSAWEGLFVFTESDGFAALAPEDAAEMARVIVTTGIAPHSENTLVLHPKTLHIGIGCRRGAKEQEILELILGSLEQLELSRGSIADIASADVKQFEQGLQDAAETLDVPLRFFSVKELDAVPVTNVSPKAQEMFGVDGVCEPAAMLAAGENAALRLPKHAARGVTIAIAQEAPIVRDMKTREEDGTANASGSPRSNPTGDPSNKPAKNGAPAKPRGKTPRV